MPGAVRRGPHEELRGSVGLLAGDQDAAVSSVRAWFMGDEAVGFNRLGERPWWSTHGFLRQELPVEGGAEATTVPSGTARAWHFAGGPGTLHSGLPVSLGVGKEVEARVHYWVRAVVDRPQWWQPALKADAEVRLLKPRWPAHGSGDARSPLRVRARAEATQLGLRQRGHVEVEVELQPGADGAGGPGARLKYSVANETPMRLTSAQVRLARRVAVRMAATSDPADFRDRGGSRRVLATLPDVYAHSSVTDKLVRVRLPATPHPLAPTQLFAVDYVLEVKFGVPWGDDVVVEVGMPESWL